MGMTKEFFTRIQLKYDSWANWQNVAETFRPLPGEVCIVEVPQNGTGTASVTPPSILMKVGRVDPNNSTQNMLFKDLDWLSAKAADVHTWAKMSESEFKTWLDTTAGFATDAELASVSSAVTAVDGKVDGAIERIGVVESDLNTATTGLKARMTTAEGKISTLETAKENHAGRIEDLEIALGTSGSSGESISSKVATLRSEMDIVKGADTVAGSIAKAEKDAKAYADSLAVNYDAKGDADKALEDAKEYAKTYADTEIGKIDAAYKAADTALDGRIDKLEEGYVGQSVAYIAKDVLSKELIPEGAQESLDTLKEIGAWIQAHPEEAADMNEAIQNLENSVFAFLFNLPRLLRLLNLPSYQTSNLLFASALQWKYHLDIRFF